MHLQINSYSLTATHTWSNNTRSQRIVAASSSIAISLALLGVFTLSPRFSSIHLREPASTALEFFWVPQTNSNTAANPLTLAQSQPKSISNSSNPKLSTPSKVSALPSVPESITLSKTETQAIHTPIQTQAKEPISSNSSASSLTTETTPAPVLSNKILSDKDALKRAYLDSRSEIQKMADNSGKSLTAPHSTKYDQFQTAASAAAKADCLGPKSGGAGLLSIPLIAIAAMTDKCK